MLLKSNCINFRHVEVMRRQFMLVTVQTHIRIVVSWQASQELLELSVTAL